MFGIPFTSTVTTAAPLVIQISNPAGSGRTLYVSRVTASSATAAVTLSLLPNATVTGTTVTPVNYNFGSALTSVMTARTSTAAPTGSPATLVSLLLAIGPVIVDFTGQIVVPPGNSITTFITIASGSSAATTSISWWEYLKQEGINMPNQFVFNDNDQLLYVDMVNTFQAPDISAPRSCMQLTHPRLVWSYLV